MVGSNMREEKRKTKTSYTYTVLCTVEAAGPSPPEFLSVYLAAFQSMSGCTVPLGRLTVDATEMF